MALNPDDYPTVVSDSEWGQVRSQVVQPPNGDPLVRYAWFPRWMLDNNPKPPADAGHVPG